MEFLHHILRLFVVLLFSALGTSMAFAMPMVSSDNAYFQAETIHFTPADDVCFAARAPPLAAANVDVTGGVTVKQGSAFALHGQETVAVLFGFGDDLNATNSVLPNVPGRVQTRVNLAGGTTRFTPINDAGNPVQAGWTHVTNRHFGGTNTQSQFTLSQTEVRKILQSNRVVSAPVSEIKMINGTPTYVRTVDVGTPIGTVRQSNGGGSTSNLYVQTDSAGNLITAFPVP